MIRFSFSSFYMSLSFINITIFFLSLAFYNKKFLLKIGVPILISTVFLTMLRLLLPLEFLPLSHNIYLPGCISSIITNFQQPRFFGARFSFWSFSTIIWIIGILIFAVYHLRKEYQIIQKIHASMRKLPDCAPEYQIFRRIQERFPKTRCIGLYICSFSPVPMIYGIRQPKILLPSDLQLEPAKLHYILLHEAAHHLHHDQLIKVCMKMLCIVYWWNPFCWLLKKQADTFLEMRIDQAIARNPDEKTAYMDCLLTVIEHVVGSKPPIPPIAATPFIIKKYDLTIKKRFQILTNTKIKPISGIFKHAVLLIISILFLFSYTCIFEASIPPIDDTFYSIMPDAENSYFIKRKDGKYDFYLNGDYYGVEDSLEYYENIPVLNSEGD